MKKIIIAMSGGVDSSISAWLLKRQGNEVVGVYIKNFNKNYCQNKKDLIDVISISSILNINLKILDLSKEYKKYVLNNFIKEYLLGNTPNPDIYCNSKIKFNFFLIYALKKLKGDFIATGHYSRIKKKKKFFFLLKSKDLKKDQSYFLYKLNQKQLSKTIFPLGNLLKKDIRYLAYILKFPNAKKKDSMGLCFIENKKFQEFLSKYIPYKKGNIKDLNNYNIGEHLGYHLYTIGQRKKIGNFIKKFQNKIWYIVKKDIKKNILYVTNNSNNILLFKFKLKIKKINWIIKIPKNLSILKSKIRNTQEDQFCIIKYNKYIINIYFLLPQKSIANGQSIVLYKNNICLGGGIISV